MKMQEETESSADKTTRYAGTPTSRAFGVWLRGVGFALAGLLLCPRPSGAAPFEDWPIKPHPHLAFASSFNDNVFISPIKQGDFSWLISPGILLEYGSPSQNYITLDYTAEIVRFYRLTSQDTDNHVVTFKTHFDLNRLTLDLTHNFRDRTDQNVEVGTRIQERQNVTSAQAEYRISSKTGVGLNYRQEFHEFFAAGQTDYDVYEIGGSFFYRAFSKTDFFGQFNYGRVDEQGGADQEYEEINLGVRGKLTSKITGTAKAGYQHRQFDSGIGDLNSFVASVGLQAALSARTTAELIVSRNVDPSITSAGNAYTATRVEASVRHRALGEKLTLIVGGVYEHDDYKLPARRDDIWEGKAGVSYSLTKWLEIGALYQHKRNDSSSGALSFNQNVGTIQASVRY